MKIPQLLLLTLLAGCTKPEAPPAPSPALAEPECTLATKLVPGVPGSPGHLLPSDLNPNGASELAALMREMKNDLERARTQISEGKPVAPMHARHRKMRCAWPTSLDDRTPVFEQSAITYLSLVKALDEKPSVATLNGAVSGCLACHATACPGPIPVIEKLKMLPN